MIFQGWARKYWEQGLAVIPCEGKKPLRTLSGWQKYSGELPSSKLLELWEEKHPDLNIGVVLGQASGLVCLDIDTDALPDLPLSPVFRRGKKGEARFFKWRAGLESRNFRFSKIDFLSTGKQVILPPSIHPETKLPYVWMGTDDFREAPVLPADIIQTLERLESHTRLQWVGSGATVDPGGRNNRLRDITSAMLARGESQERIIDELLIEDAKHDVPLFSDKSEGAGPDPLTNAALFVLNNQKSWIKRGGIPVRAKPILTRVNTGAGTDFDAVIKMREEKENLEQSEALTAIVPETGALRLAYNYCLRNTDDPAPALALGAAISLMAAALSNRFAFAGVRSNMYVLNLAKSGKGKSRVYSLFEHLSSWGVVGVGNLESASSIIKEMDGRPLRSRIDLLDEVGGLLTAMRRGGQFQLKMVDALQGIWSASSGLYNGSAYATKGMGVGPMWNVNYSMLASTTPKRLSETYDPHWSEAGFLPRFLVINETSQYDYSPRNLQGSEPLDSELLKFLDEIKQVEPDQIDVVTGECVGPRAVGLSWAKYRLAPIELEATSDAASLLEMYAHEKNRSKIKVDAEGNQILACFIARHVEIAKKLALIHAISTRGAECRAVNSQDINWAIQCVDHCYAQSIPLILEIENSATSPVGKETKDRLTRSERYFRTHVKVKKSQFTKWAYNKLHIQVNDVDKILETLMASNIISRHPGETNGRHSEIYIYNSAPDAEPIEPMSGDTTKLADA